MLIPLLSAMPRKSAFTPASVAGLVAWYDASKETAADGTAMATITDRHGVRNLTAGAPAQPLLKTNIQNGRSVYRFDGVDDTASWNSTPTISNAQLAAAVVCRPSVTIAQRDLLRLRDSSLGDAFYMIKGGTGKARGGFTTSAGVQIVESAANFTASPSVFIWSVDAALTYTHRLNGVAQTGTLAGAATARTVDVINLANAFGSVWDADVCEVVISATAFSASTITKLESYFRTKWGTP